MRHVAAVAALSLSLAAAAPGAFAQASDTTYTETMPDGGTLRIEAGRRHDHEHDDYEVDSTPGDPYGCFAMSLCAGEEPCEAAETGQAVSGLDGVTSGTLIQANVIGYGTDGPFAAAYWRIEATDGLRFQGFEPAEGCFPMPDGGDGRNMGIASQGHCREGIVNLGTATFLYTGDGSSADSLWFIPRADLGTLGFVACVPKIRECPGAKKLTAAKVNAGSEVIHLSAARP